MPSVKAAQSSRSMIDARRISRDWASAVRKVDPRRRGVVRAGVAADAQVALRQHPSPSLWFGLEPIGQPIHRDAHRVWEGRTDEPEAMIVHPVLSNECSAVPWIDNPEHLAVLVWTVIR